MSLRSLVEAIQAPWLARAGKEGLANIASKDYAIANGFVDYALNNAGTGLLPLEGTDSADNVLWQGAVDNGARMEKSFMLATNASLTTQAFWIADGTYTVTGIREIHTTADGATNTAFVSVARGTQSPSQGKSLMTGTFNMNGTANTLQTATLAANWMPPNQPLITLNKGDRLCFVLASAVTSLAGVCITVAMTPGSKSITAELALNANGDLIAATSIFVATGEFVVTGVQAIWSAAGTNAGTVTYDVTKDTGTTAPGGGTSVLSAAISVKTTPNTVSSAALAATAATLRMSKGDRLAVKLNGTLTALAGVVVVVSLTPIQYIVEIPFTLAKNANLGVNQTIFIADRTYEFFGASLTFATAAGGTSVLNLTRESGTTAPGSGTTMQSGTFNLNATANTVQDATLNVKQSNYLLKGDRLSLNFANAAQASAGLCLTAKLSPC